MVRIKEIYDDGKALVIRVRESACSGDCHKCSGCAVFVLSIVPAVSYDRRVAKKQDYVYTITGYPGGKIAGSHTKGDNHFD